VTFLRLSLNSKCVHNSSKFLGFDFQAQGQLEVARIGVLGENRSLNQAANAWKADENGAWFEWLTQMPVGSARDFNNQILPVQQIWE